MHRIIKLSDPHIVQTVSKNPGVKKTMKSARVSIPLQSYPSNRSERLNLPQTKQKLNNKENTSSKGQLQKKKSSSKIIMTPKPSATIHKIQDHGLKTQKIEAATTTRLQNQKQNPFSTHKDKDKDKAIISLSSNKKQEELNTLFSQYSAELLPNFTHKQHKDSAHKQHNQHLFPEEDHLAMTLDPKSMPFSSPFYSAHNSASGAQPILPPISTRHSVALRKNLNFHNEQINFDRLSLLPPSVIINILSFVMDRFRVFLCVNPSWYYKITIAFDEYFNQVENRFVNLYFQCFLFKNSYTSSAEIFFCGQRGIRIDRVLKCEVQDECVGHTVRVSYKYRYYNESDIYRSEFFFDVVKFGSRMTWIHKNECKVNFV